MKKFVLIWFVNAMVLFIAYVFLSGIAFYSVKDLVKVSLVLTILNGTIRPLLKLIFLPITFITFGLFSLVINMVVLQSAIGFVNGAMMSTGAAFLTSILLSVANNSIKEMID